MRPPALLTLLCALLGSVCPAQTTQLPADATAGQEAKIQLPGGLTMPFCYCPPGTFTMGSPAGEKGRHPHENQVQVKISKGFWMAQTEITHAQWLALTSGSGYVNAAPLNDHPYDAVSWEEAQGFISRLNQTVKLPAGWIFALPTEAQWEYACRAGTQMPFSFGHVLNGTAANSSGIDPYGTEAVGPYRGRTVPVASFPPNAWGLHDMHGNALEWCEDGWDGKTKLPGGTDPVGDPSIPTHVRRGGNWGSTGEDCRAASRQVIEGLPTYRDCSVRLAIVPFTLTDDYLAVQKDFARFPLMKPQTDAAGNMVFTETALNVTPLVRSGTRMDGIRFQVERTGEAHAFVWAFKKPANLKGWGIVPASGVMRGFTSYQGIKNDYILQGLRGDLLVTGHEYLLLFHWKDDVPTTLRAGHRFAELLPEPEGTFDGKKILRTLVKTQAGLDSFK